MKIKVIKNWREMLKSYAFLLPVAFVLTTELLALLVGTDAIPSEYKPYITVLLAYLGRIVKQGRDKDGNLTLSLKIGE